MVLDHRGRPTVSESETAGSASEEFDNSAIVQLKLNRVF